MKRKLFFAIIAVLAMTACMRDDDWKLLKNPIHVQGHLDPNFGAPVAYGKMTFHDILGMLSSTYTGHIQQNSDVITITFDTTLRDTISNVTPQLTPSGTKAVNAIGKDTTLEYQLNISLFDGAQFDQMLADNNITIGDLWLNFNALFKADAPENVRDVVVDHDNYISSSVDNIKIFYTKHDGTEVEFTGLSLGGTSLKHLMEGDTVDREHINMNSIINDLPKQIRVMFDYHFWLTDEFILSYPASDYQDLLDSLNKIQISYNVKLDAEFPLDIRVKRLAYSFQLNLNGDSLARMDIQQTLDSIAQGLNVDLKDAKLSLAFDNHIPANFNMAAYLIDGNGNIIGDTLIRDQRIASAPLGTVSGKNISVGSTRSVIDVPVNAQRLNDLKQTRKIGFNLTLATGSATSTVAMRNDDYLYIKAFVMVHPSASADITITNQGLIK